MTDFDENVRREILEKRFSVMKNFLLGLEKTAVPDRTVVRFPNSSTYLFSTGERLFWMVDPAYNYSDCKENDPEIRELGGLISEKISFIIVTHLHPDHCQVQLVKQIADPRIRWIVSCRFAEEFHTRYGIPREQMTVLNDGDTVTVCGVSVTAHRGYHNEPGRADYPSFSCTIVLPDGTKLFMPSDVRDFEGDIPDMSPADHTFAHIFLGRDDATGDTFSKLLPFARFFTRRKSGNIILTHLYETGRLPRDLWTRRHAEIAAAEIRKLSPETGIFIPRFGDSLVLNKTDFSRGTGN